MFNKIDILNRQPFVEQVFSLVEIISENKGNTTFAIDGAWGCGKTFVLGLLEEKLVNTQKENSDENKFFVINFNCWKYDFYEEPLIAFVSSIIDLINEKDHLFKENKIRNQILDKLKKIGVGFLNLGNTVLKNKLGIDIKSAFEPMVTATKNSKESIEKSEGIEYDNFYAFKNQLNELRATLSKIAETQTIIIIVDELDRCLPEYAIKVLERLHHITEELPNTVTIIATDKQKLEKTIMNIYGFEGNDIAADYLKKFISIEIQLNIGINDDNVYDKYYDFIQMFDSPSKQVLGDYIKRLFKDISPREQEHLFEKTQIMHKLITTSQTDISVLCAELLLTVLSMHYGMREILDGISTTDINLPLNKFCGEGPLQYFEAKIIKAHYGQMLSYDINMNTIKVITITNDTNVYGQVLWYINQISEKRYDYIILDPGIKDADKYYSNANHIRAFAQTLKLIKN